MKKITLLLLLLVSSAIYSQTNGINYQALILNPNGEQVPGVNNTNAPLANTTICLQFTIMDASSQTEYQETINVKTDEFGMVNTIIGSGIQTIGYAATFSGISWDATKKSLKVALDVNGQCSNFVEISNQPFNYVPFALSAKNAENVTGVVTIQNGGTNAITVLGAKTNLGLENVDNTRDLNKPISTAAQLGLSLKENIGNKSTSIATDAASDTKYPTVKSVKTYVDANLSTGSSALTTEINRATAAGLANATAITAEATTARAAELANATAITTEATTARAAELANATAITTEATTARAAESTNANAIASETTRARAAESANVTAITTEATTARAAELANATAITTEATTARAAELANATAITTETTRATTSEGTLTNALTLKAPLASPTFTGAPVLPTGTIGVTQAAGDNSTALATTAFVTAATSSAGAGVDLTTAQTIGGVKTFSLDMVANGITVGRGAGSQSSYNTAVGVDALKVNTTGINNTAHGYRALYSNSTGEYNTAVGTNALYSNTDGIRNTANGYEALRGNRSGSYNTAMGHTALTSNTNGNLNTAIGYQTLYSNSTGERNTANGSYALNSNNTGNQNTAIGNMTLISNTGGGNNTASGSEAMRKNTTGSNNIAIGSQSLYEGTTNLNNTAIGTEALKNQNASRNTALGYQAGLSITGADNNTVIGASADVTNTSSNATALGYGAVVTASNTIQLGNSSVTNVNTSGKLTAGTVIYPNTHNATAGQVLTTDVSGVASWTTPAASSSGVDLTTAQTIGGVKTFSSDVIIDGITVGSGSGTQANTAVGYQALYANTGGDSNTAIGNQALRFNTGGVRNTATGIQALYNNTSGGENTASGYFSLKGNTGGTKNTATGYESLLSNTSGHRNTGLGVQALRSNSTGTDNTANGNTALDNNSTGLSNTGIGAGALYTNTIGSRNTALGFNTGQGITTGDNNTIIGALVTGLAPALTNNIILANGTGAIKAQHDGTDWTLTGGLTAGGITYPKVNGTSGQVLSTNGSGVASWTTPSYLVGEVDDDFTATAGQTSFTLTRVPSVNSKVKMYINGVRIRNTAYSVSGVTLTYVPSNNGNYSLLVNDSIQFEYAY